MTPDMTPGMKLGISGLLVLMHVACSPSAPPVIRARVDARLIEAASRARAGEPEASGHPRDRSPPRVMLRSDWEDVDVAHELMHMRLALFKKHDVTTVAGHREILREWSRMEGLDRFVGISAYRRRGDRYVLPWP